MIKRIKKILSTFKGNINYLKLSASHNRGEEITKKDKIIKLINKLHPIQTEYELKRIGANHDGGYLVPNHLVGIEAVFSPGVSDISEFELECIKKYNMKVFMADKSVEKPNLAIPKKQYSFIQKFVGCINNDDFITMDSWVKSSGLSSTSSDLLLQMDIEEAEYLSFINMSDALLRRFRIMVVEFHLLNNLWRGNFFQLANSVFEKILQTHDCVHIHPNNCCRIEVIFGIEIPRIMEFTFMRKDAFQQRSYAYSFPHKLDSKNVKNLHNIVLPRNWYKSN